jgi:hypothetical protein
MTLALVIHRPEGPSQEDMRIAVRDAIWEVAEAHWPCGGDTVVAATDLSPGYLLGHFRRALARRGFTDPGMLLVVPVSQKTAWAGLPADAERWMRDRLA